MGKKEVKMAKFEVPEVDVLLEGRDETFRVPVTNGTIVRYELEARKNGWPDFASSGAVWAAYCAYLGAMKTGQVPADSTWDNFLDILIQVEFVEKEAEPEEEPEDESGKAPAPVKRTRKKAVSAS
jgi:hypothetical protein